MESLTKLITREEIVDIGINIVAACLVLGLTLFLARLVRSWVKKIGLKYEHLDDTLFIFLSKLASITIQILGFVFILQRFGFETTSIVALLGAAGLAVGLALQGTLSNFAAGIMLIIFRPFKQGDFISVASNMGTVDEISIFTTVLSTADNLQLIVPNGQIWGAPITNYSVNKVRRMDIIFSVAYDADLSKAEMLLCDIANEEARIHKKPQPLVKVQSLGSSSVDILFRIWCDSSDYFLLKLDLTRRVKETLDSNQIEIPFPTTKVISTK